MEGWRDGRMEEEGSRNEGEKEFVGGWRYEENGIIRQRGSRKEIKHNRKSKGRKGKGG